MANTFDSTLVNSVLAQRAITKLQAKLAYLPFFTTDFSDEVRDARSRTINIPYVSAASAVQTNPTNFETGDNTTVNCPVTMAHLSKTSYITSADYGTGSRLENFADMSIGVIATAIEAAVFTLITEANFGAPIASLSTITAGAMSVANLKALWAALPGDEKIAILKDNEFANLLPSDLNGFDITKQKSGYGFDVIDRSGSGFASAGTKLVGFAATKGALVLGSAIPQYTDAVNGLLDSTVIEIPGVGISIQSNIWASSASRNTFHSFDVLFGAAKGDTTALKLVKTV